MTGATSGEVSVLRGEAHAAKVITIVLVPRWLTGFQWLLAWPCGQVACWASKSMAKAVRSYPAPALACGEVSASIGVVVADPDAMTAGDVLRNADLAMYDAKHHGRNRVHHFQPAMLLALTDLDSDAALEAATNTGRRVA